MDEYDEVCANCGLTLGAHSGFSSYIPSCEKLIKFNQCPGHQNVMDWNNSPGTRFEGTGKFADIPFGTPAKNLKKEA